MTVRHYPRWGILFTALISMAFGFSVKAHAGVKSKTTYQYYSVSGRSSLELVRSMYARGPRHWGKGYILAQLHTNRSYKAKTSTRGGRCRITGLNQTYRFKIILPRNRRARALSSRTRSKWKSFVRYLDRHEKTHRRIWIGCARRIEAAARRLPRKSSCGAHDRALRQIFERMTRACRKRQNAFDRRDYKTTNRQPLIRQAVAEIKRSKGRAIAANRPRGRRPSSRTAKRASIPRCCD